MEAVSAATIAVPLQDNRARSDNTAAASAGYLCVQSRPFAGEQAHPAPIKARMHAVAVEFDFVQPLRAIRRLVDHLGELRFDPPGERRRLGASPSGERSIHASIRSRSPAPDIRRFIMVGLC